MMWTTRRRSEFSSLAAIREGQGDPVLLLHGVGLRAEAWNAQLSALSQSYSAIAPDMPGHGESTAFEVAPSLSCYTDRIAVAMAEPMLVAGHSMGAMIGLDLAVRYPEKVRGIIAVNATYRRSAEAQAAILARVNELDGTANPDPSSPLKRWFGGKDCAEATACEQWLRNVDPKGYHTAYSVFAKNDAPEDDALANLRCPAVFVTGENDPNSTPAMTIAMAALAPSGQGVVTQDAAHMLPMTHPDVLNNLIPSVMKRVRA